MSSAVAIGVDLGGTHCRCAVVGSDGAIHHQTKEVVGDRRSPADAVAMISTGVKTCIESIHPSQRLLGIGAGIPGIIQSRHGVVIESPHFPEWDHVDLRNQLHDIFRVPVIVDNDVNMAARGEGWVGAMKDVSNFVMITLGTGIGGAIVINGDVWHGDSGYAGELGHMVVDVNGPGCACGGRGCWEMYASVSGFPTLCRQMGIEPISPDVAFERASHGDEIGLELFERMGRYLGIGLASTINALDIERVVIGGGISRSWNYFHSSMIAHLHGQLYADTAARVSVVPSTLVDTAAILGSARSLWAGKSA